MTFKLLSTPIEQDSLYHHYQRNNPPHVGGIVTFEGRVRNQNDGHSVSHLVYEAYAPLASHEALKIIDEIRIKFEVDDVVCLHRTGSLEIGELAVWIFVTAIHRQAAFLGAEYMIDELKKRVPIWKKEFYKDGHTSWVVCKHQHGHQSGEIQHEL